MRARVLIIGTREGLDEERRRWRPKKKKKRNEEGDDGGLTFDLQLSLFFLALHTALTYLNRQVLCIYLTNSHTYQVSTDRYDLSVSVCVHRDLQGGGQTERTGRQAQGTFRLALR